MYVKIYPMFFEFFFTESSHKITPIITNWFQRNDIYPFKISFFKYPYPLVSPKSRYKKNIFLAGIPDIATMKLEAIGSRGSYKDFIDIYFLLQKYSLEEMLGFVRKKFTNVDYNEAHLLKALIYFEEVKGTPKPKLIKQASWRQITNIIRRKVKNYLNNLWKF